MNSNSRIFKPENRYEIPFLIFLCVLTFIVYQWGATYIKTDYGPHSRWALAIGNQPFFSIGISKYPLWHLLTKFFSLFEIKRRQACGIATGIFAVMGILFLYKLLLYILRERENTGISRNSILVIVTVLSVVSAIYMPWFNKKLYLGQGTINVFHNPTYIAVKPFVFFAFYLFLKIIDDLEKNITSVKDYIIFAITLFLSVLAKPSFMQFFIFAAYAVIIPISIKKRNLSFFLNMTLAFMPTIFYMVFATISIFNIFGYKDANKSSAIYLKFQGIKGIYTKNIIISLILFMAFPFWVTICRLRSMKKDIVLILPWICFIIAYLQALFLNQKGAEGDGNFSWGYLSAASILWTVCLARFVQSYLSEDFRRPTHYIGLALLSAHIIAGLFYVRYVLITGFFA